MTTDSGVGTEPPLVTVIMPTHDHATTVDLAIDSVLGQTVRSLELVVIADGATPAVREAVAGRTGDGRLRFIDGPKTASRAELVRHEVIAEAASPFICYTGDDDILLPDHVEATLERLVGIDFTHPLPVFIDRHGHLQCHPTDLADPRCREWHLQPDQNAVSLTGAAHRRESYLKLPHGWREPPTGVNSDHYMWQQWFAHDGFTFSTGNRLTLLKFDASVRKDMDGDQRRAEILQWLERASGPGFETWLAAATDEAFRRSAVEWRLMASHLTGLLAAERDVSAALRQELSAESECHAVLLQEAADELVEARLSEQLARERATDAEESERRIRATKTWRLHEGLVRRLPLLRRPEG